MAEGTKVFYEIVSLLILVLSVKLSVGVLRSILKKDDGYGDDGYLEASKGMWYIFVATTFNSYCAFLASVANDNYIFCYLSILVFALSISIVIIGYLGDHGQSRSIRLTKKHFKTSLMCGVLAQVIIIFCLCKWFNWKMVIIAAGIYLLMSIMTYLIKKIRTKNQLAKKSN